MTSAPKTEAETDAAQHSQKRRRTIFGLILVFVLVGLGYLTYWFFVGRFYVVTDDAYIGGNLVAVTSRVPGTVVAIAADDTDFVRAGQPLVTLNATDARIRLTQREAALALAVRHARAERAQLHALQASAQAAWALYQEAAGRERRRRSLVAIHAISQETWQDARAQTANLKARYLAAVAAVAARAASLGHGPLFQLPAVRQATAALAIAYAQWHRTVIRAPVSGYIAKREVELGQHITPGRPLMVVIPLTTLWVTANIKEDDLGALRIGQPARIVADIYGSAVVYHGHVVGIGAGTGSAFSLLPPTNASGNWIKIVQRVPVRISLPAAVLARHPLRVGLSATATINIHNTSGRTLARRPPPAPVYHTDVYGRSYTRARQLAQRILRANGARRGL